MPVMNGPTACYILRKLGYSNPIIGISGNVLPEDVKFFKQHGANGVLPKPLKLADLEKMWNDEKLKYNITCEAPVDISVYEKLRNEISADTMYHI